MKDFDFEQAQKFELDFHRQYVSKIFTRDYQKMVDEKLRNPTDLDPQTLSEMWEHNFFNGDINQVKNL